MTTTIFFEQVDDGFSLFLCVLQWKDVLSLVAWVVIPRLEPKAKMC